MYRNFARVHATNNFHDVLGMARLLCTPGQLPYHSGRTSSMLYGEILPRDVKRSMTVCYEMLISCSDS